MIGRCSSSCGGQQPSGSNPAAPSVSHSEPLREHCSWEASAWESEDGPTKIEFCFPEYWDCAVTWIGNHRVAIEDRGDGDAPACTRVFDLTKASPRCGPGRARHAAQIADPLRPRGTVLQRRHHPDWRQPPWPVPLGSGHPPIRRRRRPSSRMPRRRTRCLTAVGSMKFSLHCSLSSQARSGRGTAGLIDVAARRGDRESAVALATHWARPLPSHRWGFSSGDADGVAALRARAVAAALSGTGIDLDDLVPPSLRPTEPAAR